MFALSNHLWELTCTLHVLFLYQNSLCPGAKILKGKDEPEARVEKLGIEKIFTIAQSKENISLSCWFKQFPFCFVLSLADFFPCTGHFAFFVSMFLLAKVKLL